MFLKNRNISSKIKRSKVTDYAALNLASFLMGHMQPVGQYANEEHGVSVVRLEIEGTEGAALCP